MNHGHEGKALLEALDHLSALPAGNALSHDGIENFSALKARQHSKWEVFHLSARKPGFHGGVGVETTAWLRAIDPGRNHLDLSSWS